MNRIRRIAAILSGLAASVLVTLTGATAAFAYPVPPPGGPAAGAAASPGAQHHHRGYARLADRAHRDRRRDPCRRPGGGPRPGPHRTQAAACARRLTRWPPSSVRVA